MPHRMWDLICPTREGTHAPLHWKHWVLTTGPPGNSHRFTLSQFVRNPGTTELIPLSPSQGCTQSVGQSWRFHWRLDCGRNCFHIHMFFGWFSPRSWLLGWEPWLDSWLALGCPQLHTNLSNLATCIVGRWKLTRRSLQARRKSRSFVSE